MLDEASGEVRVENGVELIRNDRVQSVRARLNRLCPGPDLDFKRSKGACTIVQFGRGKNVRVFCECRAESVDSAGFPAGSVQCDVYPLDMRGYRTSETKELCALVIVEPMKKFRGRFIRGVRRDVGGLRERCRW